MKKLTFVAIAMVAFSAWAADLYQWNINWAIGGAYSPDSLDKGPIDDYDVTWSLVFSDGTTYSWSTLNNELGYDDSGNGGSAMSFDEYLMADTTTLFRGPGSETQLSASVHQRIDLYTTDENHVHKYYWIGESFDASQIIPGTTVDTPLDIGSEVLLASAIGEGGANAKWNAVPEPATMSLLGLGALAMVLRRKLRK